MVAGPCAQCAHLLTDWKSAAVNRERLQEEQGNAISQRDWDLAQALDPVIAEAGTNCERAFEVMLGHVRANHGIDQQPARNRHFVHLKILAREDPP